MKSPVPSHAALRPLRRLLILTVLACAWSGCSKDSPVAPSPPEAPSAPGTGACTFSVAAADHSRQVGPAGAEFSIAVTTAAGCAWSVSSNAAFISMPAKSYDGSGYADIHVDANAGAPRTGTATVAGQGVEISQAAPPANACDVKVDPAQVVARARGEALSFAITAAAGCAWSVTTPEAFLSPRTSSGAGSAQLIVDVQANPGRQRKGSIGVGSALVSITQDPTTDCVTGAVASKTAFGAEGGSATMTVSAPAVCDWSAETKDSAITLSTPHSGGGDGQFTFDLAANASSSPRTMAIAVGGRTVSLSQDAGAAQPNPPSSPNLPPPNPPPQPPQLPGPSAGNASFFSYASQPGDYIGAGGTRNDVAPAAQISASATPAADEVDVVIKSQDGSTWGARFVAPTGQALMPGAVFNGATRFASASAAGLDVFGNGRGCNTISGRFVVNALDIGPANVVRRFDVSFEQHCEGAAAALIGQILVAPSPAALPSPTSNPTTSALTFTSDPGDFIGAGRSWSYSPANATFGLGSNFGNPNVVAISVTGNDSTWWTVSLAGAGGAALSPGLYDGAIRLPFNGSQPGFDLSGSGRGCNMLTATFRVYEVTFAPGGTLRRFQATFEQHCEGMAPASRGEVIYIAP